MPTTLRSVSRALGARCGTTLAGVSPHPLQLRSGICRSYPSYVLTGLLRNLSRKLTWKSKK